MDYFAVFRHFIVLAVFMTALWWPEYKTHRNDRKAKEAEQE